MAILVDERIDELGNEYESETAENVLRWALNRFGDRVALATSFGAEDVVVTDILLKVNPEAKIFTLDTGRLPEETYKVWEEIEKKYGTKIKPYSPDTSSLEGMIIEHGPNPFYSSVELRRLCCKIRKVDPLHRALSELDAWTTGLRREQSVTRAEIKKIEHDKANDIVKLNPITDWTEKQVWDYIKKNDVPYNALHDKNYPSIGCAPCTRAIEPGEDVRAGRWWWEDPDKKECGLHK